MILENVRPLMIVWLPVKANFGLDFGLASTRIGSSFIDDAVDFVMRRTGDEKARTIAQIPIPFYFYERLGNDKENDDSSTGFLLDSCEENIDLSYPDTPTTQSDTSSSAIGALSTAILGTSQETFIVKNTIDVSFRVKVGSTPVSIFRSLMKRVLTNPDSLQGLRFSWFWREYVLSYAKCIDYNEAPISGTNLVLIKIKFQSYNESTGIVDGASAVTTEGFPVSDEIYTYQP